MFSERLSRLVERAYYGWPTADIEARKMEEFVNKVRPYITAELFDKEFANFPAAVQAAVNSQRKERIKSKGNSSTVPVEYTQPVAAKRASEPQEISGHVQLNTPQSEVETSSVDRQGTTDPALNKVLTTLMSELKEIDRERQMWQNRAKEVKPSIITPRTAAAHGYIPVNIPPVLTGQMAQNFQPCQQFPNLPGQINPNYYSQQVIERQLYGATSEPHSGFSNLPRPLGPPDGSYVQFSGSPNSVPPPIPAPIQP